MTIHSCWFWPSAWPASSGNAQLRAQQLIRPDRRAEALLALAETLKPSGDRLEARTLLLLAAEAARRTYRRRHTGETGWRGPALVDADLGEVAVNHGSRRGPRNWDSSGVRFLVGERCVRQILDIGTGLPTADNTHEVAQRFAPETRRPTPGCNGFGPASGGVARRPPERTRSDITTLRHARTTSRWSPTLTEHDIARLGEPHMP